jgi:crotonobetainyl-CoA:carnitine CoA-transferase CaiB-like acyl-CoA transferase
MKDGITITRKGGGKVQAWKEDDGVFVRESMNRGKDVQTVFLNAEEFAKIFRELVSESL